MDTTKLVKTVANFAPFLASFIPIPGASIIGDLIAHEFGGDSSNPDDLALKITADPNAKAKLAEIEANCKVQLRQLAVQNAQNQLAAQTAQLESNNKDVEDARKNVAISYMPSVLTFIIILGFFTCFVYLIIYSANIPQNIASVLYMMVGTINTSFGGAFAFWLGNSSSSQSKDVAIHNTLQNLSK